MSGLLPDGPIDTAGVRDAVLSTPRRIREAHAASTATPWSDAVARTPTAVVLLGDGTVSLAARAAEALAAPAAPVPVVAPTGTLPGFVGPDTLAVVVAAGPSPELHRAARSAVEAGAGVVGVGCGPAIEALAERDATVCRIGHDAPVGRHATPALVAALAGLLEAVGMVEGTDVDAAAAQLEHRLAGTADADTARLARRIGRTLVLAYGAGSLGDLAARRWKEQVNDDVKAAAFSAALPDLAAHELSGWGQHGDMTRQVFSLVCVRHGHETDEDRRRFDVVDELLDEVVHERHVLEAEGQGWLTQLLDLWLLADLACWHLAQVNEIDPGPTGVDERLRAALGIGAH